MFLYENFEVKKLYILVTDTKTFVSNLIKRVTNENYNHVSFSLDLNEFYTFALDGFNGMWGGFKVETKQTFSSEARYTLLEMDITLDQYEQIKKKVAILKRKAKMTYYDHLNLVNILVGKKIFGKTRQQQAICSTFVRGTIKSITRIDLLPELPLYKTTPADYIKSKKLKKIKEGLVHEMDSLTS